MRQEQEGHQELPSWLSFILILVGLFAAIQVAGYILDWFTTWAAMVAWVTFAVGIFVHAGMLGRWVSRWLDKPIRGFSSGIFLFLGVTQGWLSARLTLQFTLSTALFLGSLALLWMLTRRRQGVTTSMASPTLVKTAEPQVLNQFWDDGKQITVHADRRHVGVVGFTALFFALGLVCGFLWGAPHYAADVAGLFLILTGGMMLMLFSFVSIRCFARLMMSAPTLVVGHEGLVDNASFFVAGRGLLRWDEIGAVQQKSWTTGRGGVEYALSIALVDPGAVHDRQTRWKRAIDLAYGLTPPATLIIDSSLLDRPPVELAAEIKRYAVQHAPKGWHSPLLDEAREGERAEAE